MPECAYTKDRTGTSERRLERCGYYRSAPKDSALLPQTGNAARVHSGVHSDVYRISTGIERHAKYGACAIKVVHDDVEALNEQVSVYGLICERQELEAKGALPRVLLDITPRIIGAYIGTDPFGRRNAPVAVVAYEWTGGQPLSNAIRGDSDSHDGNEWLVMRVGVLLAIADALKGLEEAGDIVHGDVRPDNIITSRHGAKLIDLESMSIGAERGDATRRMTPGYVPPEGISGCVGASAAISPMTDVFAFGVVAHEVLTGTWPYPFSHHAHNDWGFWASYLRTLKRLPICESLPAWAYDLITCCCKLRVDERCTIDYALGVLKKVAARDRSL